MTMTDPIADLLTRIRNAQMASKPWTDIPVSKLKIRLSYVLKEENFIRDYILIKRISKPGCRNYVSSEKLPRVLNGLGIAILSTSKGVMSNKKARVLNVGGEVLCHVW